MRLFRLLFLLVIPATVFAQGGNGPTGTIPQSTYTTPSTIGVGKTANGVAGSNPEQSVSPLDFGAKADVQFVYDCSWTNATSQVTCANGDMPCVAADAGKIMFGVSSTAFVNLNAINSTLTVPQGTIISCASANVYNISTTTTATCPNAGAGLNNCNFAKGTQDDATAINNAAASAWNSNGICRAVQLPSSYMFIGSAVFNGATINNSCGSASAVTGSGSDLTSVGPQAFGEGASTSVLIPLPNFNFTTCTGGSGTACIGGVPNGQFHDFGVNGLQQAISPAGSVILFQLFGSNAGGLCAGGTTAWNLGLSGWGLETSGSASTGFDWGRQSCNDAAVYNINVIMFGGHGAGTCNIPMAGNVLSAYALFCYGGATILNNSNGVLTLSGASGSIFNSYGGMYFCPLTNGNFAVFETGTSLIYNSYGDIIENFGNCATSTNGLFTYNGGSVANFNGSQIILASGTPGNSAAIQSTNAAGDQIHLHDTTITATGTNNQMFNIGAADKIFDECGNVYSPGTRANTFSAGALFSPCPTAIYPSGVTTQSAITGTGACASPTTVLGTIYYGSAVCPGTTGASTFIITPGPTALNGWNCQGTYDKTTYAVPTALTYTTTACTVTFTSVTANDVISFKVQPF